jgi:hypothetical protein
VTTNAQRIHGNRVTSLHDRNVTVTLQLRPRSPKCYGYNTLTYQWNTGETTIVCWPVSCSNLALYDYPNAYPPIQAKQVMHDIVKRTPAPSHFLAFADGEFALRDKRKRRAFNGVDSSRSPIVPAQ